MPRVADLEQVAQASLSQPSNPPPGDPLAAASPGPSGPVIPTPMLTPMAQGLRGQRRLDNEIARNSGLFSGGLWGHDFNAWIQTLQGDPLDPEYSLLLQNYKLKAAQIERGEAGADSPIPKVPLAGDAQPLGNKQAAEQSLEIGIGQALGKQSVERDLATQPGVTKQSAERDVTERSGDGTPLAPWEPDPALLGGEGPSDDEEKRLERKRRLTPKDLFVGTPVSDESLGTPEAVDPVLSKFMDINGKNLDGPQANYAKRSGAFVFMGTESENGVYYDKWMYHSDAQAGLHALGLEQIKGYQAILELPQTGYPDDNLLGLWKEAVRQAQLFAQSGLKITPQQIFNSYVISNAEAIKKRKAGGGGGGGIPLEEMDYYRGMMQILGDISGVGGG